MDEFAVLTDVMTEAEYEKEGEGAVRNQTADQSGSVKFVAAHSVNGRES